MQSVENPLTKIKPGLLSNADQPIPLKAVHVRARLLDLAAQVSPLLERAKKRLLEINKLTMPPTYM